CYLILIVMPMTKQKDFKLGKVDSIVNYSVLYF
ncbi:MAG: hypothetical protein ACI8RD_012813, partial [Bacillariaceae sp.]